jgi:hypothetical protein
MTDSIQLGASVRDKITGFSGVVTGRATYITGCDQVLVAPPITKDDGALPTSHWFDSQRLTVLDAPIVTLDNRETPGPDAPAPIK